MYINKDTGSDNPAIIFNHEATHWLRAKKEEFGVDYHKSKLHELLLKNNLSENSLSQRYEMLTSAQNAVDPTGAFSRDYPVDRFFWGRKKLDEANPYQKELTKRMGQDQPLTEEECSRYWQADPDEYPAHMIERLDKKFVAPNNPEAVEFLNKSLEHFKAYLRKSETTKSILI